MAAFYPLAEQIKDTIAVHGHAATAKMFAKKIPFTLFHFYAFGYLPRTRLIREPIYNASNRAVVTVDRVVRCF